MARAALAVLASLEPEARARMQLPFEDAERTNWHYVPRIRLGLPARDMTPAQNEAAAALLRTGLSREGAACVATIRGLEDVLLEMERGRGPVRDPEMYYLTVFGQPGDRGVWGWRFEGHHVSLHWTVVDGVAAADTPQFLGCNPAEVRHGPRKGTRALAAEEDMGYRLLGLLAPDARRAAIVRPDAPADILTAAERTAAPQKPDGVAWSAMDPRGRDQLLRLVRRYAEVQCGAIARARIERVRQGGLEHVRFAWMGSPEPGGPHYYRIQGPAFLIELDNTQNDANHIHTVWRDFTRDFGRDVLGEHYRARVHEPPPPP